MSKCFMAVHKETGKFFISNKGARSGYSKINFLKSSMSNAEAKYEDYMFVSLSFDENLTPVITEENKNK